MKSFIKILHNLHYYTQKLIPYLLGVIIFLMVWEGVSLLMGNPAIPNLSTIGSSIVSVFSDGDIANHLISTLKIVIGGLSISFFTGIITAILSYEYGLFEKLFFVPFNSLKNVSAISFFPLLIVLMGIGDLPRIFIIIWTSFPAIYLSMLKGLRSVNREIIEAALNVGATKLDMLIHILFPLSLGDLFTGVKVGISGGFISLVVSEMLGASRGLGFMIIWETNSFEYPNVYAYIIIVALIGLIINVAFDFIVRKLREEVI